MKNVENIFNITKNILNENKYFNNPIELYNQKLLVHKLLFL